MILYSERSWCVALSHIETLGLTNFRVAALIAVLASIATAGLIVLDNWAFDAPFFSALGIEVAPYTTLTSVLGFLLSFRTSQAYNRFWDGASAAYEVTGGLYMAASNLMAFALHGSSRWEEVEGFKQTVARLMSLLSAMMLTHLEGKDTLNRESGYEILDLGSLHMAKVRVLATESKKTEIVIQWIKIYIIERINSGQLTIPAPILTRVFQELDVSVGRYHAAEKLSQVPFPFPYAATIELILVIHTIITPIVLISLLGGGTFLPVPCVGIIAFFMWGMHLIAGELENPYNGDTNDLDLAVLQHDLNEKLISICKVAPEAVPILAVEVAEAAKLLAVCRDNYDGLGLNEAPKASSLGMVKPLCRASQLTRLDRTDTMDTMVQSPPVCEVHEDHATSYGLSCPHLDTDVEPLHPDRTGLSSSLMSAVTVDDEPTHPSEEETPPSSGLERDSRSSSPPVPPSCPAVVLFTNPPQDDRGISEGSTVSADMERVTSLI